MTRGAYHVRGIGRRKPEFAQSGGYYLDTFEEVRVYGLTIRRPYFVGEASLVYNAYLFDDRRLARFTRA